jgi:hypothetical protein
VGFVHRVGNFFLLAGIIGLLVFAASVLVPDTGYNITAFLVGALLFGLGLKLRMSKPAGRPHEAASSESHAAAKSGPPHGGGKPGAPKRQGLLNTISKGPADRKKTAPAPPKPQAGGGGRPPAGKGGGGGKRKK